MYVDDIILAGKTEKKLAEVKTKLSRKFDINDLGELIQKYFLEIKIEQRENNIWIGQPAYTKNLLKSSECKTANQLLHH